MDLGNETGIAIYSAITALFLTIFKLFINKVHNELHSLKSDLNDFQDNIIEKFNVLDKSFAVKSSIINFLQKEIEVMKGKLNERTR